MEEPRARRTEKEVTPTKGTNPQRAKILTKPLPQILDDIEDSIGLADEAAKNAREAAEEARRAGEKAASEAARVAAEAIARVEQTANNTLRLAELINSALIEASVGLEKRLSEKS